MSTADGTESIRTLEGMPVRVAASGGDWTGAIREHQGLSLRIRSDAPIGLHSQLRIILVDPDERFGTVQFFGEVTSLLSGRNGPELWLRLRRVVAAADRAYVIAILARLFPGQAPSAHAFRENGPWTSCEFLDLTLPPAERRLDDARKNALPIPHAEDAAPVDFGAVSRRVKPIQPRLLADTRPVHLPLRVTVDSLPRAGVVHLASQDGERAFIRASGKAPRLGDRVELTPRLDLPAGAPAAALPAMVAWVDTQGPDQRDCEFAIRLSARLDRPLREAWNRALQRAEPGGSRTAAWSTAREDGVEEPGEPR